MGFMDISISGSDRASDFTYAVGQTIAQIMQKELKEKSNCWNTSGDVNVALFFEEIIVPSRHLCYNEDLIKVAQQTRKSLQKWFKFKNRNKDLDTDYKRLIRALDTFIQSGS